MGRKAQVRFLGGWARATASGNPTNRQVSVVCVSSRAPNNRSVLPPLSCEAGIERICCKDKVGLVRERARKVTSLSSR